MRRHDIDLAWQAAAAIWRIAQGDPHSNLCPDIRTQIEIFNINFGSTFGRAAVFNADEHPRIVVGDYTVAINLFPQPGADRPTIAYVVVTNGGIDDDELFINRSFTKNRVSTIAASMLTVGERMQLADWLDTATPGRVWQHGSSFLVVCVLPLTNSGQPWGMEE